MSTVKEEMDLLIRNMRALGEMGVEGGAVRAMELEELRDSLSQEELTRETSFEVGKEITK